MSIAMKLDSYIATRERLVSKRFGYERNALSEAFRRLLDGETVRMGGRASCGSAADNSWIEYRAWKEIVKKARSLGLVISETPLKQQNAWATKAGGFWHEDEYQLAPDVKESLTAAKPHPEKQGGE